MQRCVLTDPFRARIWSVGNVEIGLAYFGVFLAMLFFFLRMHAWNKRHLTDLTRVLAYLVVSFAIDYAAVQLFEPFVALVIGDALVITFTAFVSRQMWFQRLLGVFVPIIFLTCGIGHFLEGLSYWHLTYYWTTPWTMVTADIGFAVLLNASRFPAFLRGEDLVEELRAAQQRVEELEPEAAARAEAEKARRKFEAKYDHLFTTMALGVVHQDAAGEITAANLAAQRMLGLSSDSLRGRTAYDSRWQARRENGESFPAEERPAMAVIKTGLPVLDVIVRVHNPRSNDEVWLRVNSSPEFAEDDRKTPIGVFTICEDITEKHHADEALRHSQTRLSGIIDSAVDAIITTDEHQTIIAFNPAAQQLFGYAKDEIIGRPFAPLITSTRDTLLPLSASGFDLARKVQLGHEAPTAFLARRKDGSEFPVEATVSMASLDDVTFYTVILRDVTERERSARQLREKDQEIHAILDNAPLILWATDSQGDITLGVGKALETLGIAPNANVGLSILEINRNSPTIVANLSRALFGEPVSYDVQIGATHFHTEVRPRYNALGMPEGVIGVSIDTTERVRAEQALEREQQSLRRSRAMLADAEAMAHVGSLEANSLTGERFWSDELFRICGRDPSEGPLSAEDSRSIYHPDDLPRRDMAIAALLERGAPLDFEHRIVRPSGEIRWCHQQARATLGPEGKVTRVVGVIADITDRVLSEERFSALFEGSQDAVMVVDQEAASRIVDCNVAAVALLGCQSKSELIGWRPNDFSPEFQPSGLPSSQSHPRVERDIPQGRAARFEWLHRTKDERNIPVEVVLTPVTIGERHLALVVMRDLTERRRAEAALRESEQRLRLALEGGGLAAWELDVASEELLGVTDRAKTLWGLPADHPFTWEVCKSMIHPDDLQGILEAFSEAIAARSMVRFEHRLYTPDGSLRWHQMFGAVVVEPDGSVRRMVGVTMDITDRKRYEQEQEVVLHEAEERADHDPLTGLWNHRVFHRELRAGVARAEASDSPLALALLDIDNFKFFNDAYGYATGDDVLRLLADRLRSLCGPLDRVARFGGDEFALLLSGADDRDGSDSGAAQTPAALEASLHARLAGLECRPTDSEYAIPITIAIGVSVWNPAAFPENDKNQIGHRVMMERAEERLRAAKTGAEAEGEAHRVRVAASHQATGFSMLDALVTAVDNKDRYTRRHSEDVMTYSLMIARELGMDESTIRTIAVAALLHDVGKIGVPDAILRKPGRLTPEESRIVRQHPEMGAVIVSAVPGMERTLDAIRYHHERWDGKGYPQGLKGSEIPLIARLLAVADAFSAMTTSRPYRRNMGRPEAIEILKAGLGTQWDPVYAAAFLAALNGDSSVHTLPYSHASEAEAERAS